MNDLFGMYCPASYSTGIQILLPIRVHGKPNEMTYGGGFAAGHAAEDQPPVRRGLGLRDETDLSYFTNPS
jgi:hypothetical protein